ncbi:MAG: hypothetical protein HQK86_08140 [Nitrospinae bacterium]|nr:hypothetical protein [Nitrospinota bacterium]MBF0633884.1 hypothetical protein [Nitrospinota bacterium]
MYDFFETKMDSSTRTMLYSHLATIEPVSEIFALINNVKDFYEVFKIPPYILCTEDQFRKLVRLVLEAKKSGMRFRQNHCLKCLKRLFKINFYDKPISADLISELFELFKLYHEDVNQEIGWIVTVMLKDRTLNDEHIHWLIEHTETAVPHTINRLLRYPNYHQAIAKWAKVRLEKYQYEENRISEYLGLLINGEMPELAKKFNESQRAWAIYYSRLPDDLKKELLIKSFTVENCDDIAEICSRLHYPDVIKLMIEKCDQ